MDPIAMDTAPPPPQPAALPAVSTRSAVTVPAMQPKPDQVCPATHQCSFQSTLMAAALHFCPSAVYCNLVTHCISYPS